MKKKQLKQEFKMLSGIVARAECKASYNLFIDYKNKLQCEWTEKNCQNICGRYLKITNHDSTVTGCFMCNQEGNFEELVAQIIMAGADVQMGESLIGGKFDEDARKVFSTNLHEMEYAYARNKMLEAGTTI